MKFMYILFLALVALALHLAWTGILAPALAGSKPSVISGAVAPALAGGADGRVLRSAPGVSIAGAKPGIVSGSNSVLVGGRGGMTGEFRAGGDAPAIDVCHPRLDQMAQSRVAGAA